MIKFDSCVGKKLPFSLKALSFLLCDGTVRPLFPLFGKQCACQLSGLSLS